MLIKSACTHCDGHIEFSEEDAGKVVPCPHCSKEFTLTRALPAANPESKPVPGQATKPESSPPPKEEAKAEAKKKEESKGPVKIILPLSEDQGLSREMKMLGTIRAYTCYGALRRVIAVIYYLLLAGVLLPTGYVAWLGVEIVRTEPAKLASYHLLAGAVVTGVILVSLVMALRQAALLLVDIADCLIHQATHPRR